MQTPGGEPGQAISCLGPPVARRPSVTHWGYDSSAAAHWALEVQGLHGLAALLPAPQSVPPLHSTVYCTSGAQTAASPVTRHPVKIPSGMQAETIQLGASTVSLILRSIATEQRMSASWSFSPCSCLSQSIM